MFGRKKQNNEEKIIEALDALDKVTQNLDKYGTRYNSYIDDAAIRGDDARAKQLIKQKIRVYALIDQLKTLKCNIELGAYTAQAISELGKLPAAISGCKGLLMESPDFSKLGKSIASIFEDINASQDEIAKLNEILEPKPIPSISSILDGVQEPDKIEDSDQFKAEYAESVERIKRKIAPEMVAKPELSNNNPNIENNDSTGEIDYAGIIEEENKKK